MIRHSPSSGFYLVRLFSPTLVYFCFAVEGDGLRIVCSRRGGERIFFARGLPRLFMRLHNKTCLRPISVHRHFWPFSFRLWPSNTTVYVWPCRIGKCPDENNINKDEQALFTVWKFRKIDGKTLMFECSIYAQLFICFPDNLCTQEKVRRLFKKQFQKI
jgi:hypothetical protein